MSTRTLDREFGSSAIAIVGLACRFPGAPDARRFWHNLRDGIETITFFTDDELVEAGVASRELQSSSYVPAKGYVENATLFDAEFFGMTPREAEITDPQQRIMLECAWQALEEAGYGDRKPGPTAVVVSGSTNAYLRRLLTDNSLIDSVGLLRILLGNDKEHLASWISYKLDLTGPSLTVQTACSSSLVAVHTACQFLLTYQCDLAVAGGVTLGMPSKSGYIYEPGGILSPDGHCRSFDAGAKGSVPGEGAGILVLRRMADAITGRDNIHAVIRGSAINNDGTSKVGFTAPSVAGQARVIELAHADAEIDCSSISYVEAHGSATPLGDPVEMEALIKAFANAKGSRIGLGSVKSNIGHAGGASGIAGLIKTIFALENRKLPASLHFKTPNPEIDFANSPFEVVTKLRNWETTGRRIAGVSSFGLGGTNAHVVVQEAPPREVITSSGERWRILPVSARTSNALKDYKLQLSSALASEDVSIADLSFTLQSGRKRFDHRFAAVCRTREDALKAMHGDSDYCFENQTSERQRPVVFLFPGVGDHYPGMATELYEKESAFRCAIDECAEAFKADLGQDLRKVVFTDRHSREGVGQLDFEAMIRHSRSSSPSHPLDQTLNAHCSVFAVEYALAQLWISYGVKPAGMLGYSLGECVCAAVSGVLPLDVMARVVAKRVQCATTLAPSGAMLAVPLPEDVVLPMLEPGAYISGIAGPDLTIVAGSVEAIDLICSKLSSGAVSSRYLASVHPFHTPLMRAAGNALSSYLAECEFQSGSIPYVSNLTGQWITPRESMSRDYWGRHLCEQVRLSEGLLHLMRTLTPVFLELGPGQMLASLASQLNPSEGICAVSTLPARYDQRADTQAIAEAGAKLWLAGADIKWDRFMSDESGSRIPLPTYPFQRQRYEVPDELSDESSTHVSDAKARFQAVRWRQSTTLPRSTQKCLWIVLDGDGGLRQSLSSYADLLGRTIGVTVALEFAWMGSDDVQLDVHNSEHFRYLIEAALESDSFIRILIDTNMPDWETLLETVALAVRSHKDESRIVITPLTHGTLCVQSIDHGSLASVASLYKYASAVMKAPEVSFQPVDIGVAPLDTAVVVRALLHAHKTPDALAVAVCRRVIWLLEYTDVREVPLRPNQGIWAVIGDPRSNTSRVAASLNREGVSTTLVDSSEYFASPQNGVETDDQTSAARLSRLEGLIDGCDAILVHESRTEFNAMMQVLPKWTQGKQLFVVLMNVHARAFHLVLHQELTLGAEDADIGAWFLVVEPGFPPEDVARSLITMQACCDSGIYFAGATESEPHARQTFRDSGTEQLGKFEASFDPEPSLSETERIIAGVWDRILGVGVVHREDNFFRIGGNSLLGLRVTSELRRIFEVDLSPHSLFESPTLSELAKTVEGLLVSEIDEGEPEYTPYEHNGTIER